ncbi:MAG: hypothetical protein WCE21_01320 [Candidatus Babeliales bacterium]
MKLPYPLYYCLFIVASLTAQEPQQQSAPQQKQLFRASPSSSKRDKISDRLVKLSPVLTSMLADTKEKQPVIEFPITQKANKELKLLFEDLESSNVYSLRKKMERYSPLTCTQLFYVGEYYEIPLLAQCALEKYVRLLKTPEQLRQFVDTFQSVKGSHAIYNPHNIQPLETVRVAFNSYLGQYGDAITTAAHIKEGYHPICTDNNAILFIDQNYCAKSYDFSTRTINNTHSPYEWHCNDTAINTSSNGFTVYYKNKKVYATDQTLKDVLFSPDGSIAFLHTYETEKPLLLNCANRIATEINFDSKGGRNEIEYTTISGGSSFVALQDTINNIYLHDTKTGVLLKTLSNENRNPFVFTRDEKNLIIINEDAFSFYEIKKDSNSVIKPDKTIPNLHLRMLTVIHPDNQRLFIRTSNKHVTAYNITTGQSVSTYATEKEDDIVYWELSPDSNYLLMHYTETINNGIACFDANTTNSQLLWARTFPVQRNEHGWPLYPLMQYAQHNTLQLYQQINTVSISQTVAQKALALIASPLPITIISPEYSLRIDLQTGELINAPFAHLGTLPICCCNSNLAYTSLAIVDDERNLYGLSCNQWSLPQALTIALLLHNKNNPDKRIKFTQNQAIKELFYSLPESIQKLHSDQLPPQKTVPWWHAISIAPRIANVTTC